MIAPYYFLRPSSHVRLIFTLPALPFSLSLLTQGKWAVCLLWSSVSDVRIPVSTPQTSVLGGVQADAMQEDAGRHVGSPIYIYFKSQEIRLSNPSWYLHSDPHYTVCCHSFAHIQHIVKCYNYFTRFLRGFTDYVNFFFLKTSALSIFLQESLDSLLYL